MQHNSSTRLVHREIIMPLPGRAELRMQSAKTQPEAEGIASTPRDAMNLTRSKLGIIHLSSNIIYHPLNGEIIQI